MQCLFLHNKNIGAYITINLYKTGLNMGSSRPGYWCSFLFLLCLTHFRSNVYPFFRVSLLTGQWKNSSILIRSSLGFPLLSVCSWSAHTCNPPDWVPVLPLPLLFLSSTVQTIYKLLYFFSFIFFIWSLYVCFFSFFSASTAFLAESQPPNRRALAVYPIFLFYFVISWMILTFNSSK